MSWKNLHLICTRSSLSFIYSCVEKIGFQQTEQTGTARHDK